MAEEAPLTIETDPFPTLETVPQEATNAHPATMETTAVKGPDFINLRWEMIEDYGLVSIPSFVTELLLSAWLENEKVPHRPVPDGAAQQRAARHRWGNP